jgi:hypothetical protein
MTWGQRFTDKGKPLMVMDYCEPGRGRVGLRMKERALEPGEKKESGGIVLAGTPGDLMSILMGVGVADPNGAAGSSGSPED